MTSKKLADYLSSTAPTLVEFYGAGKAEDAEVMVRLKNEFEGKANVLTIDGTENQELMKTYKVDTYPTFLLFKDGQVAWRDSGRKGFDELRHMIEDFI